MPTYEQVPIRLQLSLVSAPPVSPIDINTGQAPSFWQGENISIQVGIFDAGDVSVDLSNLSFLQCVLSSAPDALSALASVTVLAADIIPTVNWADWLDNMNQQASFVFNGVQTDVGLGGGASQSFWLAVQGQTTAGARITYGAGWVTVYSPGSLIPTPANGFTSFEETSNIGGNVLVSPGSQMHTEVITVTGSAGTRKVVLQDPGLQPGAHVWLRFGLPATAGIIFQVFNLSLLGTQLSTIQTASDGSLPSALLEYVFDGSNFRALNYTLPSA